MVGGFAALLPYEGVGAADGEDAVGGFPGRLGELGGAGGRVPQSSRPPLTELGTAEGRRVPALAVSAGDTGYFPRRGQLRRPPVRFSSSRARRVPRTLGAGSCPFAGGTCGITPSAHLPPADRSPAQAAAASPGPAAEEDGSIVDEDPTLRCRGVASRAILLSLADLSGAPVKTRTASNSSRSERAVGSAAGRLRASHVILRAWRWQGCELPG